MLLIQVLDASNATENNINLSPPRLSWEDLYPLVATLAFSLDVITPAISTLGCIGNTFTMIIISKWSSLSSGAAFMFALALTDFMASFYDGIIEGIPPLFEIRLDSINDFTCAFGGLLSRSTTFASFYMTVLFSVDKCLAVVFPFGYRQYGKPKACVIATVILYCFSLLQSFSSFFVQRKHPTLDKCYAANFDIVSREIVEMEPRIAFFSAGLLPIAIVTVLLVITIAKIQINAHRRQKLTSGSKTEQSRNPDRRGMEITRQMIVVTTLFDLLLLSSTLIYLRRNYMDLRNLQDQALMNILKRVAKINTALINSANFYLYIIFGQKFRSDFLKLFSSKQRKRSQYKSSEIANKTSQQNQ